MSFYDYADCYHSGYDIQISDDSTDENNDVKEFIVKGYTTIEFEGGFAEENITNNNGFRDVVGDYHYVTNYFISADELENLYDRALYLENEIKQLH